MRPHRSSKTRTGRSSEYESKCAGLRARKPAQVAKIALARKLLTVVRALLHHGVGYGEESFIRG